jgi:tetratricopeptide (TPR) repeat protein
MKQFAIFLFFVLLSADIFGQNQHNAKVDSMESMLGKVKADSIKVKLLLNISDNIFCDDTIRSTGYIKDAVSLSQKIKWSKGEMLGYLSLGNIHLLCKHNTSAALTYFKTSAGIGKTLKDIINQAEAYNGIGRIYMEENKQDSALDYFAKCMSFNKNPRNQTNYLGNSGVVYVSIGDYLNALRCYDKALKITEGILRSDDKTKMDSLTWLALLTTIGDVYVAMPQLDKALDNYNAARKLADDLHLQEQQIWALNNIGKVYRNKKDYAKAIQYYEKSLEASNSLKKNDYKPTILNEISKLYIETGDLANALKYAEQALTISEHSNNNNAQELAKSYTTIGIIRTKTKDYNKAVNYLLKALTVCQNAGLVNEEKDVWEALSNAYKYMRIVQ